MSFSISDSASSFDDDDGFKSNCSSILSKNLKFFTFDEVIIHNTPKDVWVVINCVVFDLTPMFAKCLTTLSANMAFLLAFGGKDLSAYFDQDGMPRTRVAFFTGAVVPIFPPAALKVPDSDNYWWQNTNYQIGRLTRRERPIRIINTITGKTHKMIVCDEDKIYDIQSKYRNLYNHHAGSYIWRKHCKKSAASGRLFSDKTLTQNGILSSNKLAPALWLFYMNDFTIG